MPPVSRALQRCRSETMPGSLYPRSPSLEPEHHMNGGDDAHRNFRFESNPSRHRLGNPSNTRSALSSHIEMPEAGPSSPRSPISRNASTKKPSILRSPSRPRPGSMIDDAVRRFSDDADPSLLLPSVQLSPNMHRNGRSRMAKGKAKAISFESSDAERSPESSRSAYDYSEPIHGDSSGEIRVRGKERELIAVIEEQKEKEQHWEGGPDTTQIYEDRLGFQEKIRLLEEEVRQLREEVRYPFHICSLSYTLDQLAKRPSTSSNAHAMPPPPPPPPPFPMTSIRAPTSSSADTESLFASVRASLRHAPTPVEVPINSVVYGGAPRMRRTGQPTVNVPSDKMAAFLTEMKTVRLRKVGGGLTEAQGSGSGVGEKRKRDGYSAEEVQAVKRRQTMAPVEITRQHSSDLLSRSFSGLPSTHSLPGPSSLSQSLQPSSIRNWPSVTGDGADLATPSLTSDGDLDGENSLEERLPPTPPIIPLNEIRGPIRVPSINKPLGGEEISDISILSFRNELSTSQHHVNLPRPSQTAFDKRVPSSPMPADTPKKPKPPARTRGQSTPHPKSLIVDSDDDDDDDDGIRDDADQLAAEAAVPEPELRPSAKGKRKEKGRAAPVAKSSRIPVASAGNKTSLKSSRSTGATSARNTSNQTSNKRQRRRTLDEELRQAEDVLQGEDLNGVDLEDDELLIGVGSRSKKKGFLAHGGAGGQPVFMGVGYVEGVEEIEPEEWEEPVRRKTKKKGKMTN